MEEAGKTLEGESPLLKDGALSERGLSPSKPPSLTENFPQEHPPMQSEDWIRFV